MAKVLKCKDVVPGCKTILEGRDEVEVVVKEAEHVLVAHKMKRIPGTLLALVTAAVADRVERMPCVLAGYLGGAQADDASRSQLQEQTTSHVGLIQSPDPPAAGATAGSSGRGPW